MPRTKSFLSILSAPLLTALAASATAGVPNLSIEASLSGGSISNLYSDSSFKQSQFRGTSLDLKYALFAWMQVNISGEYTYYRHATNLSNLRYGSGLTLIPTPDSSRFKVYLSGTIRDRHYRDAEADSLGVNANEFTGIEQDVRMAVGYDLTPTVQVRTSIAFNSIGYDIDGVRDKETIDATIGANFSLFDRFALDLELGYSTGKYQYISPVYYIGAPVYDYLERNIIASDEKYDILLEDDLNSIYVSPRMSTNLGSRTGLSLTYMIRNFQNYEPGRTIYGYSSGWLSPWIGSYDGQGTVLRIKSYLIPRLIVNIDVGYWERHHLRVVEQELYYDPRPWILPFEAVALRNARDRSDYRSRVTLTVKLPLAHSTAYLLEPTLSLDYTDNKSTVPVYDYYDISVSGGVTVRF